MSCRHISVRTGLLLAALCLVPAGCSGAGTQDASGEPDEASMRADLKRLGRDAARPGRVRAVVVATSDEILLERYRRADRETTWDVRGVTGSVVSMLVGAAVDEGLIEGPEATLDELLPQHARAMSPPVARTTLRQLLTMTAGFRPGTSFTSTDDWVRAILRNPRARPGNDVAYSPGTAHLLAAIVARASGTSVLDFARSRLLDPLGIDTRPAMQGRIASGSTAAFRRAGFAWPRDPQGVHAGWAGLELRPRDLVELGRLVLDGGIRDGLQLVSKAWLDDATSPQVRVDGRRTGFGYLWWTDELDGEEAAVAVGSGGRLLVLVPARDLVVVTAGRGIGAEAVLRIVEEAVVAHVPRKPLV